MIDGTIRRATHAGTLDLGGIPIDCWVMHDETRLLSQRGMQRAIGLSTSGGSHGAQRIAALVARWAEKVSNGADNTSRSEKQFSATKLAELAARLRAPVLFNPPSDRRLIYGYEATVLADLCDGILQARDAGVLHPQQLNLPHFAELLMRGFAAVGIVALVDEATGFQESRERRALEKVFKQWIAENLRPWTKAFPDDFYTELYRLRGWDYTEKSIHKRPGATAYYTNDLVYLRLAPGVLKTLQDVAERDASGRLKHRLHQRLTLEHGDPALKTHLEKVVMLMRISGSWKTLISHVDHVLPRYDANLDLFPDLYIPPPPEDEA